ncbi:MAG TPA: phosphoglycerate dehydrogenase [Polyangiaceae bacterium]|nr:phosphoglycerate dehydrogenase [Polyangiaceae bacterium]
MSAPFTATSSRSSFPKDKIQVLLLENIHDSARQLFQTDGFQVELLPTALGEAELAERVERVHVLGIRSKTHVTDAVLARAKRLLSVGCFCIGTNQVDLAAANTRGVPVFNAPFSNTRSVAEMIIAEIVVLARQLGDRSREVHAGKWRKVATHSYEIRGKTLGIVGYGHIGRQVGVLAESMGMRVVFYDRTTKLSMGNNKACVSLAELLGEADFVTLHVPATRETEGMIGAPELERMKKGAYLLNASRGTVVRIPALAEAIRRGHIGGAAIDVYPEEPESNGEGFVTALQNLPNVILTPHIGGSTGEAQEAIGREVATSLLRFVNTGGTRGAVNFPQIEMPPTPGAHRILNVHRNVPGVLRDVNQIVSSLNANILAQTLSTDAEIGYLVTDLEHDVSDEVSERIAALATSIRTRILY